MGSSVINALRRWIIFPIVLGLLGASAGLVAGTMAKPSAQALLRVESAATDGTMKIVQESTLLELDMPTPDAAAQESGRLVVPPSTHADRRGPRLAAHLDHRHRRHRRAGGDAGRRHRHHRDRSRIEAELDQVTAATRDPITGNT